MTGTTLISRMADKRHLDPDTFYATIKNTLMPSNATTDQLAAFLMVADRYGLDPLTREIYAFPNRKGTGITPVVSIDGWINLVNSHPQCDGFSFEYGKDDEGHLRSITCTIWRKDRSHPITVTEFYSENYRNTEPWNQMPGRMLRHKAFKEAARLAFGFAGITDEDEARDFSGAVTSLEQPMAQIEHAELDAVKTALDQFAASVASPSPAAPDAAADRPSTGSGSAASQTAGASTEAPPKDAPVVSDRAEAIDKILALAIDKDLSIEERREELELKQPIWMEKLVDQPAFVTALFDKAALVADGKVKPADARKYLNSLK